MREGWADMGVSTLLTELLSDTARFGPRSDNARVRVGRFIIVIFFFRFFFPRFFFFFFSAFTGAIFYRPTHYAQASGAICPVDRRRGRSI